MNAEDLATFALQRVTAYDGMPVDATLWTDAHDYHRLSQRLHARAFHGWGIVAGLQVLPTAPPSRSVVLQPGLAADREGNIIRVPQPVRLAVPQAANGTLCLVLRFVETPVENGPGVPTSRMTEFYHLVAAPPPLRPSDIEVARLEINGAGAVFAPAAEAWNPRPGEIDLRFRRELRPDIPDTLTIGQLALAEGTAPAAHRRGLLQVLRELRATAPFVVQYLGDLRPEQAVGACDLLYVTGAGSVRATPKEGAQLLAFLRGGGMLFAEPCVALETERQENGRFVATFQRLLGDLKQDVAALGADDPVLRSRYVFGAIPEGAGGHAPLLGRGSIVLNPNDYGCCWQGHAGDKPLPREQIRSSTEFGVNLAWHAADAAVRARSSRETQPQPAERGA